MNAVATPAVMSLSMDDLSFAISACERELHSDRETLRVLGEDVSPEIRELLDTNIAKFTERAARFRAAFFEAFDQSNKDASL